MPSIRPVGTERESPACSSAVGCGANSFASFDVYWQVANAVNTRALHRKETEGPITELLAQVRARGGPQDARELIDRLAEHTYGELRRLAARCLAAESPGRSLTATDLAHEALMRLASHREVSCRDRVHLYSVAARIMRRLLIDRARKRHARRHGAGLRRVPLDRAAGMADDRAERILAVDEALTGLGALDPFKAAVVELRFFGGLSVTETAEALGSSRASVNRHWRVARGWLQRELAAP